MALIQLLFATILLLTACGGEKGTAPEETTEGGTETPPESLVIVNSAGERVPVRVEIADDNDERRQGLMERTDLPEDAGMLFIFDREQTRSFWMRNTLIPLSIAYIDSEGRIVDIQDMEPLDETSRVSAEPAQYALEVNQGFFAQHRVEVGDTVELPETN